MKILFATSECVPFIKTGGLADVAAALPKELIKKGLDIRVVLPNYSSIAQDFKCNMSYLKSITVPVGWREQHCGIFFMKYEGVSYYFIDNEYYFKREGSIYGHYDEAERFAFFSRSVLEIIPHIDFEPDIVHCNDWHTGMVSTFLDTHYRNNIGYEKIKTVYTIHNLRYQGIFSREILGDILGLGKEHYHIDCLEFYGDVSFMKGGLNYSQAITTVSETYSREIQTEYYGERLDGFLRKRKNDLFGIVNGIDYQIYNPECDTDIAQNYNIKTINKKINNKIKLLKDLNMPIKNNIPLIGMVSRIDSMKGFDLIIRVIEELLDGTNLQMVILGTGDTYFEDKLLEIAGKYRDKLSVNIKFNDKFAHEIYAGSDMFLMPSAFEPCGLSQMIALRYGSIPIVRETGGLSDTVFSFNEQSCEGNGFSFKNYNAHDMLYTIKRAIGFYQNKDLWNKLIGNAMSGDYSWENSANKYVDLYKNLLI